MRLSSKNKLRQKSVMWSPGTPDGFGGTTGDVVSEIDTRWEEKTETFMDEKGVERMSRTVVWSNVAFSRDGWLYKGTEDSLPSAHGSHQGAYDTYHIASTGSTPNVKGDQTLYQAWLV